MMVQHPEVVKRAQSELDQVIGRGQLPTLEDRPSLPYIECVVKEVWRYLVLVILSATVIDYQLTCACIQDKSTFTSWYESS